VHVKPEFIEAFIHATLENARQSLLEPGVDQFDVLQQESDPSKFLLMEGYKDESAPARHKETTHYHIWKHMQASLLYAKLDPSSYAIQRRSTRQQVSHRDMGERAFPAGNTD
jgi:quinol monooxygenase YgiN